MSEHSPALGVSPVETPQTEPIPAPAPGIARQPHWARRLGGGMLAVTAAALAFHGSADHAFAAQDHPVGPPTPAPLKAGLLKGTPKLQPKIHHRTKPVVQAAIGEVSEAPLAPPERSTTFQLGIVTGNSLTDDVPNFFPDSQYLGLNGMRVSLFRTHWRQQLPIIQNDVATAPQYGIQYPVVNLGDTATADRAGFPKWAARMMTLLPTVQAVVIENEVNAEDFYAPNGEQDPITRMHMAVDEQYQTYQAIKAVRPDVQVYAFGLDSIMSHDPVGFLENASTYAFDEYGGLQNIADGISFHCYLDPKMCAWLTEQYEGITFLPLRMDEEGRNVANGISLVQQARQTGQIIMHAANDPQVQSVLIYHLQNPPPGSTDIYQTGLKSYTGMWLPVASVVRQLAPVVTAPPDITAPEPTDPSASITTGQP